MRSRHFALPGGKTVHLAGWRKDQPSHTDRLMTVHPMVGIPEEFDLRGSPCMPPILDQGDIGSCTCESSKNAVRFEANLQSEVFDPSSLWLYAKVREYEGTPLAEDSGAQIRDVVRVLEEQGVPSEASWKYEPALFSTEPPDLAAEAAKHKVLVAYRCSVGAGASLRVIKAAISQGRPVVGGFMVPESMMTAECAQTGIVELPKSREKFVGGHAVLFVGYKLIGRVLYLVFMNSWGPGWADKGFGFLDARYVTEGYADDFWAIRRIS